MKKVKLAEFSESQRFTQWWLWLLMIVIAGSAFVVLFVSYLRAGSQFWSVSFIISVLIIAASVGILALMRLETIINDREIRLRFFPFVRKKVKLGEVKKMEVLDYGFVGGWGIRLWTKYGTAYNVRGSRGLAVELKNGKKFLIGTQKEDELKAFIERLTIK
ncbi:MAG: hypothetical protein MI784_03305 [Cytophagales bacterium]|nr:hypothetical protein [Cytophagales bacterium]